MLVIWNERARPLRARRGAERCVMSWPANTMRPASGRRLPASWPMKVVLPAPFGPMMACVSPSRTSRSMPSLARSAPKLFVSPLTSSIGLVEDPRQAAAEKDHRKNEERSEDHLPVLGPSREQILYQEQRKGAEHRSGGARHAAEDHHEHHVAGLLPAHQARRDVVRMVAVERAGKAAHRTGDDECRQAIGIGREADGARAGLVRLRGAQHHAKARVDD